MENKVVGSGFLDLCGSITKARKKVALEIRGGATYHLIFNPVNWVRTAAPSAFTSRLVVLSQDWGFSFFPGGHPEEASVKCPDRFSPLLCVSDRTVSLSLSLLRVFKPTNIASREVRDVSVAVFCFFHHTSPYQLTHHRICWKLHFLLQGWKEKEITLWLISSVVGITASK